MFGKSSTPLSERAVIEALRGVKDPDLGRDLVDLGMIKDIKIGDGTLSLTVNLTTPACPMKRKSNETFGARCRAACRASMPLTSR